MVSLEGHRPRPRLGRYPPVRAAVTAAASRPLRWSTPNVWSATEAAPEPILQRVHGVLNADCDIPSSAAAGYWGRADIADRSIDQRPTTGREYRFYGSAEVC